MNPAGAGPAARAPGRHPCHGGRRDRESATYHGGAHDDNHDDSAMWAHFPPIHLPMTYAAWFGKIKP